MSLRAAEARADIKVISFDVDGTLVSPGFVDCVWLEGIPQLYAEKEDLSFEQAFDYVKSEYDKIGEHRIEWYNIDYWLRKFGLAIPYETLFRKYEAELQIYEEVERVLTALRDEGYELILSSNAATEFIEFQIQPIKKYFSQVFSATSDFGQVKKTNGFFARVCGILDVKPQAVVHIGDHWVFDFINPRKIGITAYYLDRERKERIPEEEETAKEDNEFIISDLNELIDDPVG
ncbi:MAG TPA: HAD family hydrolase [Desulfobacteria bacterium]|nr:HAD family hydrolase [Desulfobacteria bacterium]